MSTLPVQSTNAFCSAGVFPAFAIHPSSPISVVVPASGTCAVAPEEPPITTYPPAGNVVEYTYASYGEKISDDIFKLSTNNPSSWTLSLPISSPSTITNPVLTSLTYIIKYATTHDRGNSTVQADVVLTTASCPVGILTNSTDLGIYRNAPGYGPRMVDNSKALCLSSAPAIKCNGGTAQWSHYLDHKRLIPNVRVVGSANLYLNFHVFEYPTAETHQCLAIEVSAAWSEIPEALSDFAVAEKEKEKQEAAITAAPVVADEGIQDLISTKIKELNLSDCPNGYKWNKTATGYICGGGGHEITFEQLGMRS